MKMTASACAPRSIKCLCRRHDGGFVDRRAEVPSASVRSSTSSRRSRSAIGRNSPHNPQVWRRSRRRISSTSRKPRVVITPMRGPRRSNSVLVPTVVPCTIEPKLSMCAKACRPCEKARRFVAAVRRHFGDAEAARRLVETEQIGEGAADVDADGRLADCARSCARLTAQTRGLGAVDFVVCAERDAIIPRAASTET